MKKYLFLIATAITLGFTSCSEEECDHMSTDVTTDASIVGSWYEEAENEEMRFAENGTFYDKYCNVTRSGETEGRWEYDSKNNKLTYTYSFMGQSQFADWTVKNLKELSFTISSTMVADHLLEKIVETYHLAVGETANILFSQAYPSYVVQSYTSKNERLASVTSDGIITAEGEKGTTYIKVASNNGNVWVKVVVGDDCLDLWYDYVSVIGMDYDEMSSALRGLGEPYNLGQDYAFGFIHNMHDYVDIVKVYLDSSTKLTTEIQILLKEGVPEAKVLSYMDSHYYKFSENSDYVYFSTLSNQDESKAIVAYDKSKKTVLMFETQTFFNAGFWPDLTSLFGVDDKNVKTKMDEYEYPYLMTDYSYSVDGSDYYQILGNEYANMVGFVFNPDNVVSEYWVYLNTSSDPNSVYSYLQRKYEEEESESTDKSLVFYNEDKTIKIVFDLNNASVVYTNLTLKQHESKKDEWVDYSGGLRKTNEQIIETFGIPYSNDDEVTYYWIGSSYVNLCAFNYDSATGKCNRIILTLNENLPESDVVELMTSKYVVFANGTMEDGSQYAWTDGASVKEATMGIIYTPKNRMLIYQTLN